MLDWFRRMMGWHVCEWGGAGLSTTDEREARMGTQVRWMAAGESITVCDCVIEVVAIRGREVRVRIIEPDGTVREEDLTADSGEV